MPRFFIDTSDQQVFVRDEVGMECADLEAAKAAAIDALPDMARDELPDGDYRVFLAVVRGDDGGALLHCALTLTVTPLAPGAHAAAAAKEDRDGDGLPAG